MGRKNENTGFVCLNCKKNIQAIKKGTIRNHCPFCLYSLHVDIDIGDRLNNCQALMQPVSITSHSKKGWQIIHHCTKCGFERKNILADDDDINSVTKIIRNSF